jgi:hypothetical protein
VLERYEDLVQYVKIHGNALVPQTYKDNPEFGKWVSSSTTVQSWQTF